MRRGRTVWLIKLVDHRVQLAALNEAPVGDHLVQEHADAKQVRAMIDLAPEQALGGHVACLAQNQLGLGVDEACVALGQPEVQ